MHSMTAFARKSMTCNTVTLSWELRSVNHRFLETHFRLPDSLRPLELAFREQLQTHCKRGKFDVLLKLQEVTAVQARPVSTAALEQLQQSCQQVAEYFPKAQLNVLDILKWEGICVAQEAELEPIAQAAKALLSEVLLDLVAMRAREGERLKGFIQEQLGLIETQRQLIAQRVPQVLALMREKLQLRFQELQLAADTTRVEQELAYLIQKADIEEELQRLSAHGEEMAQIVEAEGVQGRRLDFLLQEMNREANTITSKSQDVTVTKAAVDVKVLVEQIKEQVQNIE